MTTSADYTMCLHDALPILVDQGDLALGVGDEGVVVVPRRHPELGVGCVALEPLVELAVVEIARLAEEELLDLARRDGRSEEHTSELQAPCTLVCRLLPEKT